MRCGGELFNQNQVEEKNGEVSKFLNIKRNVHLTGDQRPQKENGIVVVRNFSVLSVIFSRLFARKIRISAWRDQTFSFLQF